MNLPFDPRHRVALACFEDIGDAEYDFHGYYCDEVLHGSHRSMQIDHSPHEVYHMPDMPQPHGINAWDEAHRLRQMTGWVVHVVNASAIKKLPGYREVVPAHVANRLAKQRPAAVAS